MHLDRFNVNISYPLVVIKYLTRVTWRRKGLFQLTVQEHSPLWQENYDSKNVRHPQPGTERNRSCAQLIFSFWMQHPNPWNLVWAFPPQTQSSNSLTEMPRCLAPGWFWSCQVDNYYIIPKYIQGGAGGPKLDRDSKDRNTTISSNV